MHSGEVQIPVDEGEVERGTKNTMTTVLGSGNWFVWDPCGIVCAVVTYMLIAYGEMVVLLVLFPPFPTFGSAVCVLVFTTLATLAVVSHLKAMFTDPVSTPPYMHTPQKVKCGRIVVVAIGGNPLAYFEAMLF